MDEPYDARAAAAGILGCSRDELTGRDAYDGNTRQIVFERAGQYAGRLILGGPTAPLDGTPDKYYEVVFEEAGGRMHPIGQVRDTGIVY